MKYSQVGGGRECITCGLDHSGGGGGGGGNLILMGFLLSSSIVTLHKVNN